jgi:hypothetical protein
VKSDPGPPMTLGNAAAARVRLIVWCKSCQHPVEPEPAEMAARCRAPSTPVTREWGEVQCGIWPAKPERRCTGSAEGLTPPRKNPTFGA